MKDFKEQIASILVQVINMDKEEIEKSIEVPKDEKMGDYAFPCFRLAKTFGKAPNLIAEELKNKIENAYELLKNLSRGKTLTKNELHEFVKSLPISDSDKKKLLSLKPSSYVGLASKIVEEN